MLNKLCSPALLYLGFSLTHILIDTFKGMYNSAFFKSIVAVIFTLLLNIMCERGLNVISWIIVFIPFILMTYITAVLLYVFGLDPNGGVDKVITVDEMRKQQNNYIEIDIHETEVVPVNISSSD
tara:strand:+ start:225 stop:596 length:372 start_codon:yes stop_codon:yes gene_type:complete